MVPYLYQFSAVEYINVENCACFWPILIIGAVTVIWDEFSEQHQHQSPNCNAQFALFDEYKVYFGWVKEFSMWECFCC